MQQTFLTTHLPLITTGGEYHESSPGYQVSLPRRTISLGKETQRPVVHIRNGYRGASEEGDLREEE